MPVFNEDYLFYIECLTRRFYPVTKTTLSNTETAKKPVFFYVFIFLNKVSLVHRTVLTFSPVGPV